jgi:PAS domain-containing protein
MAFMMEADLRHKDGSIRTIELSGRILMKDGIPSEVVVNGHDVTRKKQDERRITHLINVLKAIRQVNKCITSETEPMKLLKSVCDIAVERGYSTAWAVIFDDGRNPARMVETGIGTAFDEVRATYGSGRQLSCTDQVISGGDLFVNEDPLETCTSCPLMSYPSDHIHVAKPLTYAGNIFGQFSVTLPKELFSPEELSVLGEIAEDLSFALHHLLLGQEKEEYHLSMVKMKKMFQERFTQMQRPTLVVNREGSAGRRLRVEGASNAFLDAMGFDGAITGMEMAGIAENVSDGEELARVVDEVLRTRIPQSLPVRSALSEADYIAFVFAPGTDYAGVMLMPSGKAERSLRIGRRA